MMPHDITKPTQYASENLKESLGYFLKPEIRGTLVTERIDTFLEGLQSIIRPKRKYDQILRLDIKNPQVNASEHAELLILDYILAQKKMPNYPYIGISKPPCFACESILIHHRDKVQSRKGHGHVYVSHIPEGIPEPSRKDTMKIVQNVAREVALDIYTSRAKERQRSGDSEIIQDVGKGMYFVDQTLPPMPLHYRKRGQS
ncbi:hypothetical protein ABW20_dc0109137 [Dactylellina cionopaga]|nr:hypothetical protein ABW20_dc0109137 [Dactylellina cionopaga]